MSKGVSWPAQPNNGLGLSYSKSGPGSGSGLVSSTRCLNWLGLDRADNPPNLNLILILLIYLFIFLENLKA